MGIKKELEDSPFGPVTSAVLFCLCCVVSAVVWVIKVTVIVFIAAAVLKFMGVDL